MSRLDPDSCDLHPFETLGRLYGPETVGAFHDAFAGLEIFIPYGPKADHPISKAIGHEAAVALGRECGGVQFSIPSNRARRVAAMCREGKTVNEIARALAVTTRAVWSIKAKLGLTRKSRKSIQSGEN